MANYRPVDSKREEFRKYLERAGVMETLTKVLITLYEEPEKPADALEYISNNLIQGTHTRSDENSELATLMEENARLKERLAQCEGAGTKPQTPHRSEQSVRSAASKATDQGSNP